MIVIPFINTVNFAYAKEFWLKSAKVPVISGLVVDNILDVSADIEAVVDAMGADTVVTLEYGLTLSYGSSITFPQSPVLVDNSPVTVSVTLNSLLPYKRYFYRIIATNSKGSTIVANNFVTLEPLELTDGNWVAMYDANYEKNALRNAPYTRSYTEIRDKQFDCALDDVELIPDPDFNSSAGWSNSGSPELVIEDGKLKYKNSTVQRNLSRLYPNAEIGRLHALEVKGIVQTAGGGFRIRLYAGTTITNGSSTATLITQDGDIYMEYYPEGAVATAYYYIINYSPYPTTLEFEYASLKVVKGNHLLFGILASRRPYKPLETDDFIRFNGTSNALFARYITNVGTCYGVVKRNGIDSDFVFVNDLTGIGARDATNNQLWIGREGSTGSFYGFDMKWLNIRSVTDSAEVIAKLNEWFSRESHELPPLARGILGTGIWNDAAIHDDAAIPVTI